MKGYFLVIFFSYFEIDINYLEAYIFLQKERFGEKLNIEMDNYTQQELMSRLVSMNIFQFTPKILDLLYQNVEQFKKDNHENETIEALLPNFLNELINQDKIEILCKVCSERCIGLTYKDDIERIKKDLV